MTDECGGHEMLNHLGHRIRVTAHTIRNLDIRGYLRRDKQTGLLWMDTLSFLVFSEAEISTPWHYELGPDCSGPNQVVCRCPTCRERTNLDDVRLSQVRTRQIVDDVKAGRKN